MYKRNIISIIVLASISIGLGLLITPSQKKTSFYLNVNNKNISLLTVDTPATRTQGLSDMQMLPEDSGMLFVFDRPDEYGFWMKDMNFPIDIIWLNTKKEIVHIEKNLSPESYPQVFYPPQKSLYVLEVNSGFSDENKLAVGNVLDFRKR